MRHYWDESFYLRPFVIGCSKLDITSIEVLKLAELLDGERSWVYYLSPTSCSTLTVPGTSALILWVFTGALRGILDGSVWLSPYSPQIWATVASTRLDQLLLSFKKFNGRLAGCLLWSLFCPFCQGHLWLSPPSERAKFSLCASLIAHPLRDCYPEWLHRCSHLPPWLNTMRRNA